MVKKLITAILVLALSGLTGCAQGKAVPSKEDLAEGAAATTLATATTTTATAAAAATATSEQKLKIVTTVFPQYDFARQVGGEYAEVSMLLKPGAETHSFEPTPQDIKAVQNADLFIHVGGENDVWVDSILDSLGDKKPDTLKLLDCVATVEEELVEGMQGGHDAVNQAPEVEKNEREADEHVWTSPVNAIKIVEKIAAVMSEKAPAHAGTFAANSTAYQKELEQLDAEFREVVRSGQRNVVLFGDRFPFRYLADEYGLSYYAAFSGCSTESEASAAVVAFLIGKVKEENLPVVFVMENSNGKIADSICEATGAQKLTLYSCHNQTKEQYQNNATYVSMMRENVESLRIALRSNTPQE